jgi:hypothetical protein
MDPSEACARGVSASGGLQLSLCLDQRVIRYKQAKNIALLGVLLFIVGKRKVSTLLDTCVSCIYPFICTATSN